MSLLDTLRKNLDPDTFSKVADALGDDFNYDMVPRSRLNKVIAQRDEARRQLADSQSGVVPTAQPDDDSDNESGNAAPKVPAGQLTINGFSQEDMDNAVKAERESMERKIHEMQLQFATTEKLREMKFVDPQLIISAGLVDFSKVTMDEHGIVTGGLEDQLNEIAKARPYMIENSGAPIGTGRNNVGDDFGSITSKEDFLKLPTDKQMEFKNSNPDVFKGFMTQL